MLILKEFGSSREIYMEMEGKGTTHVHLSVNCMAYYFVGKENISLMEPTPSSKVE